MSDWTGVNSVAESISAGCDLEMPGPTRWRGKQAIKAVLEGKLDRRERSKRDQFCRKSQDLAWI